jgi:hypothetical protein
VSAKANKGLTKAGTSRRTAIQDAESETLRASNVEVEYEEHPAETHETIAIFEELFVMPNAIIPDTLTYDNCTSGSSVALPSETTSKPWSVTAAPKVGPTASNEVTFCTIARGLERRDAGKEIATSTGAVKVDTNLHDADDGSHTVPEEQ